jgi:hypothetical protein
MSVIGASILLLWCLSAVGFAWRGFALLLMTEVKPGRVISVSGVVAMISMWMFAGLTPYVGSTLMGLFNEFDLELPPATETLLAMAELIHHFGVLWYPIAFAMGVCALVMPEIFFWRRHPTRVVD